MIDRQLSGTVQNTLSVPAAELPFLTGPVRVRARAIAEEARDLLGLTGATLLSVSRYRQEQPALLLWDARYAPDARLLMACRADHRLASRAQDLAAISIDLLNHLSSRWPATHGPEALGFVSDGTGIGLSPDDPCPSRPGWLLRQLSGETSLACVLPFAGGTPWRTIAAMNTDALPH